jgi:hypothetical protein
MPLYRFVESQDSLIQFVFSFLNKDYYVDKRGKGVDNPLYRRVIVKYGEEDYKYASHPLRYLIKDTLEDAETNIMKVAYLHWREHHEINNSDQWNELVNKRESFHQNLLEVEEDINRAREYWSTMVPEEKMILIYRSNHNKWELGENDISIFAACRDKMPDKMPYQLVLDWIAEYRHNAYLSDDCYMEKTLKQYINLRSRTEKQEMDPPYFRLKMKRYEMEG